MAIFYGIGVGPGDKELLTIKGLNAIKNCDILVAPSAKEGGESIALNTVSDYIEDKTIVKVMHFPMGKKDREIKSKIAYDFILDRLNEGKNIGFLTIGDPYIYSTYIYLLRHIKEQNFKVKTIPGVPSFCASASLVERPLVIGDESLLIVPSNKVNTIKDEKFVVIMKVYKKEKEVIETLENKGFTDYVLVSKCGRDGEKILKTREEIINSNEYMSLILASKE